MLAEAAITDASRHRGIEVCELTRGMQGGLKREEERAERQK